MGKTLEFSIVLNETNPPVWRQLIIPDSFSLYELHHAIQLAFDWRNYHLYNFIVNDKAYGDPSLLEDLDCLSDKLVNISSIFKTTGSTVIYEYDFGDGWIHNIKLEKIAENLAEIKYPICIDGSMACPPEDCGGISGYEHLLKVVKNSKHPEYKEMVQWLGKVFDPEAFHLQKVNKELKKIRQYIKEYESD